jgi:hypothetical protein
MSTNHNRIKVADLEKNQPNKILSTNSTGELEFSDINNSLDCTLAGKALDARQGKMLQDSKVDKVAGKSLLSEAEIARLATLSNYTHPVNHPPSIISQDPSNRFVTDAEKVTWNAKQSALGFTAENLVNKNLPGGYAGLGADGKLISSQLPSITITDTFVMASQAAMQALAAEKGDVAIRTDLNKSFILKGTNPTVLADWQELLSPTSSVTSVFGRNGAVTAQTGDYNADQISETATRKFQTANQNANNNATSPIQGQLDGKTPLNGTGVNGTWSIGISGSATKWNGYENVFSAGNQGGTIGGIVGLRTSDNAILTYNQIAVQSFLGLGSAAYYNANVAAIANTIPAMDAGGDLYVLRDIYSKSSGSFSKLVRMNELGLNAYTSTAYLPLTGGRLSNNLNINAQDVSYGEGIRIATSPGGYAGIHLGTDQTNSGAIDGQWSVFRSASKSFAIFNINYKGMEISTSGNTAFTGNVTAFGDVIAYSSSDKRLKDNINLIQNPLDKIKKIGGYTFDWNEKQDTYKGHDVGVIAQEVEKVLPELVTTRENGYKAVKYEKLVALLIEGMKEQQLQIEELRQKLNNI